MKKILFSVVIGLVSHLTFADTINCQNLYVGRIEVSEGQGLSGVVFINSPSNGSGSYWVRFSGWTESEKQTALSLLMAAKLSQHRVNLKTKEASGCDIQTGQRVVSQIYLANNR